MTTAAAPNQLPESLFSPEHEGQVSAPLTPEQAPEGAMPEAGMTEDGLPQMPADQLQQALAQQFRQAAPEAAPAAPAEELAPAPVAPAAPAQIAQTPVEPIAQAPAEPIAQMAAEPIAQAPAEPIAQMAAEPVAQAPAEPISQMAAEPIAQAPAEPAIPAQTTQVQPTVAEQALAEHMTTPDHVAAQMAGNAEPASTVAQAPETVLAAIPHPDTYQQMPPATANAQQTIPALAPEAQHQLQAEARYVPSEVALPAASDPALLAPEAVAPAPAAEPVAPVAAEVAAPVMDPSPIAPVQPAGGIPEALEALSQPVAQEAPIAEAQPQTLAADPSLAQPAPAMPDAQHVAQVQPAEAAVQHPNMYAEAMAQQPELAPEAPVEVPAEAAQLAPGSAGIALATTIPAITELPKAGAQETPLVLGSDLRQLSTVSADVQKKNGLTGLFSKDKQAEAPAPANSRVSVLGADAGEKKKGFSLAGLFSRKKKNDNADLPRQIFAEQEAVPAAAAPGEMQAAAIAVDPAVAPNLVAGAAAADALAPAGAVAPAEGRETGPVREEIMLFVGKNSEAFGDSWDNYSKSGGKLEMSWSTPAFLLSFVWLGYRKVYKLAIGGFALVAGMTLVHGFAALAALVLLMTGVGLFGKSLYVQMVSKRVVEIMQSAGDPNSYVDNLRLQGGVSLPAAIGLAVLMVVVAATKVLPGLM